MVENALPADYVARLQLYHCSQIGAVSYRKLIEKFGDAESCLVANSNDLRDIGLNKTQIESIQNSSQQHIESTIDWLESTENNIVFSDQTDYPKFLRNIDEPPPLLFCKGDISLLNDPQIAIVGSRNATGSGKQIAFDFAESLAQAGIAITSGLANGIDAAAHQGALNARTGKTIAVVATGLDRVYPASHKPLAEKIINNGVLISEFTLGTRPMAGHFPRRNRIISGLSLGVLVVEAALKSGSLITARHANEQGKEVFAIPGSIHNALSKGCHQLIRQGAKLVESNEDILFELQGQLKQSLSEKVQRKTSDSKENSSELDKAQSKILECIDFEPTSIDQIVQRSNISTDNVSASLLSMELNGWIAAESGQYRRLK